jgi:hypothetical protein
MKYLDYFGGREAFQRNFVALAKRKREELGMTPEQLDIAVGLSLKLPSCAEYEKDPNLMDGWVLSSVSYCLGINLDGEDIRSLVKREIPTQEGLVGIAVGALGELAEAA